VINKDEAREIIAYMDDVGNRCNRNWNGANNVLRILGYKVEDLRELAGTLKQKTCRKCGGDPFPGHYCM